ncbi:hypothetical protein [Streptomyces silvensis]|uniref:Regulatory protein n=1 Tax=Streptomyces silvensis TaxID=1765722 RepID=A0A0W7XBZ9_9ACTN|nr:hypothetical protein [Streptomyces silvensis]KUF20343.1 hypothetical protein AT728_40400 [Streptomyces silvensis]
MTDSTTTATALASQYAAQVTSDLERNVKEQERIRAEIDTLQEQLTALLHDHTVLTNIGQALDTPSASAESGQATKDAVVPAPRGKGSASSGKAKQQSAAKKTGSTRRPAAKKQAGRTAPAKTATTKAAPAKSASTKATTAKATATKATAAKSAPAKATATKATAAKPAETTLVDLVRGHLAAQSEPRSAAEVATDLGKAHPERGIKTTVVRTTLENLVAKNRAQRSKQGTSVFYTAPDDAPAAQDKTDKADKPKAQAQTKAEPSQ